MIGLLIIMGVIELGAAVDSVVVYPDRAMVARVASVYLETDGQVTLKGLPGSLEDQSVRVKARGLRVGEVQVLREYSKEPHRRVRDLEERIETLRNKDRALTDETAVQQQKEKFLMSIAVGAPDVISKELYGGKVAPASWQAGLAFLVDNLLDAKQRIAAIERARRDLAEELQALEQELADVRSLYENRKTVTFDIHPDRSGNYRIEVDYLVYGAGWRTYYELRAFPNDHNMVLTYFSKVAQRTGEDWDNARLVLATTAPALGGTAPAIDPWYLYLYTPEPEGRRRTGYPAPAAAPKEEEYEAIAAITVPPAPPVEAGIAVWYPLPGRYTIRSGDAERKAVIAEQAYNTEYRFLVVPRLSTLAYVTGKAENTTDYLFLDGDASAYVGDDYTGPSYLATIAPGESLEVSFGVDERIRVKRELKKSKVTKGGVFKNVTRYEFTYENKVQNHHDQAASCDIVDQVPVPQDAGIKVSNVKLDPKPDAEDRDLCIYHWHPEIAAGGSFTATVSFTVEIPAGSEVQGLLP